MRQRKASASNGVVNQRLGVSNERLILAGLVLLGFLLVWWFAQEIWLNHDLSVKAAQLRAQNATLQNENASYAKDIAASSTGAAAEEEARRDGYSRPGEKLYLIGSSSRPSPSPSPPSPASSNARSNSSHPNPVQRFVSFLDHLIRH